MVGIPLRIPSHPLKTGSYGKADREHMSTDPPMWRHCCNRSYIPVLVDFNRADKGFAVWFCEIIRNLDLLNAVSA